MLTGLIPPESKGSLTNTAAGWVHFAWHLFLSPVVGILLTSLTSTSEEIRVIAQGCREQTETKPCAFCQEEVVWKA